MQYVYPVLCARYYVLTYHWQRPEVILKFLDVVDSKAEDDEAGGQCRRPQQDPLGGSDKALPVAGRRDRE